MSSTTFDSNFPSDADDDGPLAQTVPAATVIVFRRSARGGPPEVLMVQRASAMRFAAGAAVFPGGRVDPEDRELAGRLLPDADPAVAAAQVAGIRETLEETGLAIAIDRPVSAAQAAEARHLLLEGGAFVPVLEKMGWQLMPERLVPFAHWRPNKDKAFDTRFFLFDIGTGAVDIAVDDTENSHMFWTTAAGALELADAGGISVIFPTRRNLDRLAQFASFDEACNHARSTPIQAISPKQQMRDGEAWLCIPEGLGYPITAQPMATVKRG